MSDSPPPSPSLSIEIDTPPDSPSEQLVSVELTPPSAKRARTTSTYTNVTPTKRNRQTIGPTTRSFWRTDQQHLGSIGLPYGPPSVASTDPEVVERDLNDPYLHYVDLALTDGIAIYQISQTIFVVQGWNSRSLSGSVRV